MAVMVDKGFLVEDCVPCKVHIPTFLSKRAQQSRSEIRKTQSIWHTREWGCILMYDTVRWRWWLLIGQYTASLHLPKDGVHKWLVSGDAHSADEVFIQLSFQQRLVQE
ncbi:hypothetical protein CRENBAI_011602 [Crenichthys baileyi]|uniref:DDE Tnp4 domain-containing protein n=1 Tax=Crenichthys baileyi TaxID=28760 RepID=A0AAV9S0N5_9TELE